ncbi:hypothetical protein [uncultured Chryseobacterium sp.]|uniref:hypothetical protein n=1 Tax=uncultured Chryseobacterium sp. TaxID=259322 RepID=UPI0025ED852D|nr:hypothetical protein [uncultured Chryseobacterium sp.]
MRRMYYVPGLISALLIPLLFWYYGNQKFNNINVRIIDIYLPFKSRKSQQLPYEQNSYDKQIQVSPQYGKEHIGLYVSGINSIKNKKQASGIEFILNNENTYGDFVALLNALEITHYPDYYLDLDGSGHLYVINENSLNVLPVAYNDDFIRCGNDFLDFSPEYFNAHLLKGISKLEYHLTQLPLPAMHILFAFLLFINVSMLSIKERFLLRQK